MRVVMFLAAAAALASASFAPQMKNPFEGRVQTDLQQKTTKLLKEKLHEAKWIRHEHFLKMTATPRRIKSALAEHHETRHFNTLAAAATAGTVEYKEADLTTGVSMSTGVNQTVTMSVKAACAAAYTPQYAGSTSATVLDVLGAISDPALQRSGAETIAGAACTADALAASAAVTTALETNCTPDEMDTINYIMVSKNIAYYEYVMIDHEKGKIDTSYVEGVCATVDSKSCFYDFTLIIAMMDDMDDGPGEKDANGCDKDDGPPTGLATLCTPCMKFFTASALADATAPENKLALTTKEKDTMGACFADKCLACMGGLTPGTSPCDKSCPEDCTDIGGFFERVMMKGMGQMIQGLVGGLLCMEAGGKYCMEALAIQAPGDIMSSLCSEPCVGGVFEVTTDLIADTGFCSLVTEIQTAMTPMMASIFDLADYGKCHMLSRTTPPKLADGTTAPSDDPSGGGGSPDPCAKSLFEVVLGMSMEEACAPKGEKAVAIAQMRWACTSGPDKKRCYQMLATEPKGSEPASTAKCAIGADICAATACEGADNADCKGILDSTTKSLSDAWGCCAGSMFSVFQEVEKEMSVSKSDRENAKACRGDDFIMMACMNGAYDLCKATKPKTCAASTSKIALTLCLEGVTLASYNSRKADMDTALAKDVGSAAGVLSAFVTISNAAECGTGGLSFTATVLTRDADHSKAVETSLKAMIDTGDLSFFSTEGTVGAGSTLALNANDSKVKLETVGSGASGLVHSNVWLFALFAILATLF